MALTSVIGKAIGKLSKGYRQRVGMAQTLLHEPDVLILDEPTAGLDPNQIHEVRETIRRLGRDKTILISTHIMQEVEAIATRVLFINEGRLAYDGTPNDLTKDGASLDQRFRSLTAAARHNRIRSNLVAIRNHGCWNNGFDFEQRDQRVATQRLLTNDF